MSEAATGDFDPSWRLAESIIHEGNESDAELDAFFQECQELLQAYRAQYVSKKCCEYVITGIFKDPNVKIEAPLPSENAEQESDTKEIPMASDPIFNGSLYKEMLDTLSHLMETQKVEAYEQVTFTKKPETDKSSVLDFTRAVKIEESKSIDVYFHKGTASRESRCALRVLDVEKASTSSSDVVIRNVPTAVGEDIYTILPLYDYEITKKIYVCGHVFANNYGNENHIEIAVLRHYLECNPSTPASPECLLVEIRCIGTGELELYKNVLGDYKKLLYKYVTFS
ncbi:hypothetical protein BgAZ_400930 [Babesia gibsoni]|uniref:Uncharacterized protein n=1 Tax=Babesia gibsoni TaxID=33632 RepID=A0AAD8LII8_BABGI|nr:hypothetical protein BgAZ_400930 [Babesia gibsoni]